jgi:hypothetical protein
MQSGKFNSRSATTLKDTHQRHRANAPTSELRRLGKRALVALQAKQDRGLVGEILLERSDAHPGAFGDACGGESHRAFGPQNLNSGIQNGCYQLVRSRLLGPFPLGNARVLPVTG